VSNQAHVEFFAEAGGALALMTSKVSILADLFRRQELKDANEGLTTLASELRDLVVLIGVMQGPLEVEPARLVVDGVAPDDQIARLGGWLESLVTAQGNQDWVTVADILEHDLEPVVRGWTGVLQECAGTSK
jgi:hypothetical protein